MSKQASQGRTVIAAPKQRPMTYRQMLNLGAGNSPWKRAMECLDAEREELFRVPGADGLVRWRVVPRRSA